MQHSRFSSRDAVLLALIGGIAVILAFGSYQYSSAVSNQIREKAVDDIRLNTEIQADGLSKILVNKVSAINNNLGVLSDGPVFQDPAQLDTAKLVLSAVQDTTKELTQFYMWLDTDGRILWLSNLEQNGNIEVVGTDLSERDYFKNARDTGSIYYSTAIVSNDDVKRLYISSPVIGSDGSFKGVLAAGIELQVLGKYVESQLSPKAASTVGMMDRDGVILYSTNVSAIGNNVFAESFQSQIPEGLREPFNDFLRRSLSGGSGAEDLSYQGNSGTLAYQTVSIDGKDFGVLYVVAQHTFSSDVTSLIDQQGFLSTAIILAVGAAAVGMGVLVLSWNRRLEFMVKQRTADLQSAAESLASANEKLTAHDKIQKEFINVAAHELRTPVQPLLSIAEQLEEDVNNGVREVKLSGPEIEMLARNAKRLARLTTDILEVSRIESGSIKLNTETVDLKEKIKNAIADSRSFIQDASKVRIISESSVSEPVLVEADKPRIFEVLSNLIRNAIKFTPEGSITVTLDRNEDYAVVTVKDTGRGIDHEIMPRLFEKFVTKSDTGTGLGLFISKSIVEAHGGKIWGQNNPDGKGAAFTFTLPLQCIPAERQPGTNAKDTPNV